MDPDFNKNFYKVDRQVSEPSACDDEHGGPFDERKNNNIFVNVSSTQQPGTQ